MSRPQKSSRSPFLWKPGIWGRTCGPSEVEQFVPPNHNGREAALEIRLHWVICKHSKYSKILEFASTEARICSYGILLYRIYVSKIQSVSMSKRHLFDIIPVNISSSELSDSGGAIKPKSMDISCLFNTFLDLFLLCMSSFFCCLVFFAVRIPPWGVRNAERSCTPGPRFPLGTRFFKTFTFYDM